MAGERYFVLCAIEPKNELPAAECLALTGAAPDGDGFAEVEGISGVARSAYLRLGARTLASDPTLAGLVEKVAALALPCERFRIDYHRLPGAPEFDSQRAIVALANSLPAGPDLKNPLHRFALVARAGGYWFGEVAAEPENSWKRHNDKPYRTSSSLSPRMARALVNLVARPGDTVLNPCCGTGSLLLECAALGLTARGSDHNQRMVGMSRLNLAAFGYQAQVERADARSWEAHGDCLLADLPYNKNSHAPAANTRAILSHSVRLAPRAVLVAGVDLTADLHAVGYGKVALCRIEKAGGFVRYIHVVGIA